MKFHEYQFRILRNRANSLKTIYTAGRPPWYKSNGEQGTTSVAILIIIVVF